MKRKVLISESELVSLIRKVINESPSDMTNIENELNKLNKKPSTLRFPVRSSVRSRFELPSYSFYDEMDYPVVGVIRKRIGIGRLFSDKVYITRDYYNKLTNMCDLSPRVLNDVIITWALSIFDDRMIDDVVIDSKVFT